MKLSRIFGIGGLKPRWSFTASHVLWRFLVSEDGMILGEDRDTEKKTVSFFCLDMRTGAVGWRDKTFGEPWWTGIEALVDERLYLHGFAQPDMPEHHGLIAVDARSGEQVWQNADISFYAADTGVVIGYRDLFERRVFEKFDAASGVYLGEVEPVTLDLDAMRERTFGRTDFTFPQPLGVDDAEFELIRTACAKHSSGIAAEPIVEFARAHGRIFFGAHIPRIPVHGTPAPSLRNILCAIDAETGREELFEVLNADTPYPVQDSFFIDDATLYYIKEKQHLCAVPLE